MSHHSNGGGKHSNGGSNRPGSGDSSTSNHEEGKKLSFLQKFSEVIMGTLEGGFYKLGYHIGCKPVLFMIGAFVICGLCSLGLLEFNEETAAEKLWVPDGSDVLDYLDWIDENFPSNVLREQIIAVDANVLDADSIQALMSLYTKSFELETSKGIKFEDVCVGSPCIVYSVLEVWSYNETRINALTNAEILSDIKAAVNSPVYGRPFQWDTILGGVTTDSNGDVFAAKAAYMTWQTEGNDEMKSKTEAWEDKFIAMGKKGHKDLRETYVWAGRSWDDESGDAISGDIKYFTVGYIIVIIFVFCVLGNFNFMEQRVWLTCGGFVSIGLSILVSIGLSSAFQQDYGPLQSVLPFLLLGIGVDDMFVIMGALNNLTPEEKDCEVPELMAKVLAHAGVSITVTSLTDFVAFLIGAITIIPGLRSFCIYAAIGIMALYMLQTIFFTACLTFDIRRIRANKDGCLCCVSHSEDYEPNKCSQKQFVPYVFKKGLANIITKTPVKVVVIVATLALFGVNVWGFYNLEQYFNPYWFIPDDSYAADFLNAQDKYFASVGDLGFMYCGDINYWQSEEKLHKLNQLMEESKYITNGTTDSWFEALDGWLGRTTDANVVSWLNASKYPITEEYFQNLTYQMSTQEVPRTSSYINFEADLNIKATRFPYDHIDMSDAATEIDAMDHTQDIVTRAGFDKDDCFAYVRRYLTWETNKVIKKELYRNLALAMLCVFIVGLILIAQFVTTLFVFLGVIFTLIDVAGTMHFWDLTIDTVTSVILILSIGLAVDYSAHIGHMFMRVKGTREERVKETVREIGPPVFFGGFSTFLAFVLLANSNSYVFRTFFKVNFLVVLYGLYHGLIFLPVILSIAGPDPYPNANLVYQNAKKNNQVDKDTEVDSSGVENRGYDGERSKGSEMTTLSNLPPLEKQRQSQGGDYHPSNGDGDLNMSQNSQVSYKNPEDNPNITIVRM